MDYCVGYIFYQLFGIAQCRFDDPFSECGEDGVRFKERDKHVGRYYAVFIIFPAKKCFHAEQFFRRCIDYGLIYKEETCKILCNRCSYLMQFCKGLPVVSHQIVTEFDQVAVLFQLGLLICICKARINRLGIYIKIIKRQHTCLKLQQDIHIVDADSFSVIGTELFVLTCKFILGLYGGYDRKA